MEGRPPWQECQSEVGKGEESRGEVSRGEVGYSEREAWVSQVSLNCIAV